MEELERASAIRRLTFPYVPGLLSFREIPALLAAFARLRNPRPTRDANRFVIDLRRRTAAKTTRSHR